MSQSVKNEEQIATPNDGINSVNSNGADRNDANYENAKYDRVNNNGIDHNRIESNSEMRPAAHSANTSPESSEMLRWRADTLMDEMMFSGIDITGTENRDEDRSVSMPSANGSQPPAPDEIPVATPMQSNPWLFSAAERYRQNGYISSPPLPNPLPNPLANNEAHRNVQPESNGTRPISSNGYGPVTISDAVTATIQMNGVRPTNGAEQPSILPNSSMVSNGAVPEQPSDGMFQPISGLGPVTRQPVVEKPASAMQVGEAAAQNSPNQNSFGGNSNHRRSSAKNSNLLPRMSVINVQSLQKEVLALEEEIDLILPSSHPSNDRAHHLLHKAYTILQNDIERSAEVEYYMQQVRSIIQRTRQMHRSSRAYRQNLTLYLSAWFCLSLIILAAGYVYRFDIELWAVETIQLSADHPIFKHLIAFSTTLFAGSLGSAMGALYNMLNYGRQSYGLFDRKYGLRGLILPLIGILFGMFIYLLWGLAGNFLEIDGSLNLFAGTLLALITFVFGISQETIYGTRS